MGRPSLATFAKNLGSLRAASPSTDDASPSTDDEDEEDRWGTPANSQSVARSGDTMDSRILTFTDVEAGSTRNASPSSEDAASGDFSSSISTLPDVAADLGCGRLAPFLPGLLRGHGGFHRLQVLVLAGTILAPHEFTAILSQGAHLERLDASSCGLVSAPTANLWARLRRLRVLFLHRNNFSRWGDVENLAAGPPALEWLTLLDNPIANQPEFRGIVIKRAPRILAVDNWVVTDDERLRCSMPWTESSVRWLAGSRDTSTTSLTSSDQDSSPERTSSPVRVIISPPLETPEGLLSPSRSLRHSPCRLSVVVEETEENIDFADNLELGAKPEGSCASHALLTILLEQQSAESAKNRFTAGEKNTVLALCLRPQPKACAPPELLRASREELAALRRRSNRCSAARAIQTQWRDFRTARRMAIERKKRSKHILRVQKQVRMHQWSQRTRHYLKEYLTEIDELDLLLSAKKMLALRASKLIETNVRKWVQQRTQRRKFREAATLLARFARGFLSRRQLVREHFEPGKYQRIYFPADCSWEFLVLLNIARRQQHLPLLERGYAFEASHMFGVRIPEITDMPSRNAAASMLLNFRSNCLLRPCHSGRFSEHLWDGPFHQLIDGSAPPHIRKAYACVRRRAANVNNYCRQAFVMSCASGGHPIDGVSGIGGAGDTKVGEDGSQASVDSLRLQQLLDAPEETWAGQAAGCPSVFKLFMEEARRIGSRSCRRGARGPSPRVTDGHGAFVDTAIGVSVYRNAVWLNKRLLCYKCETERLAHRLLALLLQFHGTVGDAPLIRPVPFLMEKAALQVCAVTCIQAVYRAHRARCTLPCGLLTAAVIRRAALCVQRAWRWSILRRRLSLLSRALHYVHAVKTTSLYIEERLFIALNFINSMNRYAPVLRERSLGFGYSVSTKRCVLVRNDLRGIPDPHVVPSVERKRDPGLPMWLTSAVGDMDHIGPDDPSLATVQGLHGLLLEAIGEPSENRTISVAMPSILQAAEIGEIPTTQAVLASSGQFRFIELRFEKLAHAKHRALILFLCTYSTLFRVAVPLLSKAMLHSCKVCESIVRLWDFYGLTWATGDRASVYQLRQRCMCRVGEVVPLCGREPIYSVVRMDWMGAKVRQPLFGRCAKLGAGCGVLQDGSRSPAAQTQNRKCLPPICRTWRVASGSVGKTPGSACTRRPSEDNKDVTKSTTPSSMLVWGRRRSSASTEASVRRETSRSPRESLTMTPTRSSRPKTKGTGEGRQGTPSVKVDLGRDAVFQPEEQEIHVPSKPRFEHSLPVSTSPHRRRRRSAGHDLVLASPSPKPLKTRNPKHLSLTGSCGSRKLGNCNARS